MTPEHVYGTPEFDDLWAKSTDGGVAMSLELPVVNFDGIITGNTAEFCGKTVVITLIYMDNRGNTTKFYHWYTTGNIPLDPETFSVV